MPLSNAGKFNLIWAIFWLIVWVAAAGPVGLVGWIIGGIVWAAIWGGVSKANREEKEKKQRAELEARALQNLAYMNANTQAQPQRTVIQREIIEKQIVLVQCSYCGHRSPQGVNKCENCGARL